LEFKDIHALFYTTQTNECINHIMAWDMLGTSEHITYNHHNIRNDFILPMSIERYRPDVVFYIGAAFGNGVPKFEALRQANSMVPMINLCSDAADKPWHEIMRRYRREECFSLQVAIDGAKESPADIATITPVNTFLFAGPNRKTIRCGFSGTVGKYNSRSEIVNSLEWFGGLTVRKRSVDDGYQDHIKFLKSSEMLLNTSFNGSNSGHHMKGRVIEAGLAGCCLLEHVDSPFPDWFPEDCRIPYSHPKEVAEIIADMDKETIAATARNLNRVVLEKYKPSDIYGEILENVGITVSR